MVKRETVVRGDYKGMAEYLAGFISEKTASLPENVALNLALSGGKTPKSVFDQMRIRYSEQINWKRICIFQVDERCVPPDDPESNSGMIRQYLLHGLGFPEHQFFRMKGESEPESEARRYGQALSDNLPHVGKWPVLDVILLGLGSDGHTASLFPDDHTLLRSERDCVVSRHPESRRMRITLTLPVINHARNQLFVVTGAEKALTVREIYSGNPDEHFPASLVAPSEGEQIWLLDKQAAMLL